MRQALNPLESRFIRGAQQDADEFITQVFEKDMEPFFEGKFEYTLHTESKCIECAQVQALENEDYLSVKIKLTEGCEGMDLRKMLYSWLPDDRYDAIYTIERLTIHNDNALYTPTRRFYIHVQRSNELRISRAHWTIRPGVMGYWANDPKYFLYTENIATTILADSDDMQSLLCQILV